MNAIEFQDLSRLMMPRSIGRMGGMTLMLGGASFGRLVQTERGKCKAIIEHSAARIE